MQDDELRSVYKELAIVDPLFYKSKCPICDGHGKSSTSGIDHPSKCIYCGGSGVARQPKHIND